jgi:TonB family protein
MRARATSYVLTAVRALSLALLQTSQAKLLWISSAAVFVLSAGLTFGWFYGRAPHSSIRGNALDRQVRRDVSQNTRLSTAKEQSPGPTQNLTPVYAAGVFGVAAAASTNTLPKSTAIKHLPSAKSVAAPTQPLTYVPARPLKQVMPNAGTWGRLRLSGPTNVDVKVKIDEIGRVSDAQLVGTGPGNDGLLASAALAAAREWTFQPAKTHGRSVRSDHIIEFHFRPKSGQH